MPGAGTFRVTIGDTLSPMNTVLRWGNGDPVDLASYTVKFFMEQVDGTAELAATTTGVTAHPTQTFTASTTTGLLVANPHKGHLPLVLRINPRSSSNSSLLWYVAVA